MSGRVEQVTLKQAMPRSEAVVVARPLDPPMRRLKIEISADGAHPPFFRIQQRYRVEEVLKGKLSAGAEIDVDNPSWGYDLIAHKKRHLEGVNKITIHETYQSTFTPGEEHEGAHQILLLKRSPDGWEFTCPGSIESLRRRREIERLLHK